MIRKVSFLLAALAGTAPFYTISAARAADGLALYKANCSVCHQAEGAGMAGQFPTLKGRVDKIASSAEGKTYLTDVVLSGLHGPITAGGASYAGFMPSLKAQSDDDLAAILTYVASLGDTKPAPVFNAADLAAARKAPKKNAEILAERNALNAAHPVP
ncbi:c-type cytochrome [Acetobacter musti]|uniref:c-type cytochrome n=1 Tax=Acetobacter musti TaxID=864732 RepID=UPI00156B711D|nr:cytochrome c [Acetobacter musti]